MRNFERANRFERLNEFEIEEAGSAVDALRAVTCHGSGSNTAFCKNPHFPWQASFSALGFDRGTCFKVVDQQMLDRIVGGQYTENYLHPPS